MANIFISHSSARNLEAENIATELKNQGHNVWLDLWSIGIGDSIVEEVSKGLGSANFLVLIWTSECKNSKWVNREWMSSLYSQITDAKIKIIPVLYEDIDLPSIIRDIRSVSLQNNWDDGIHKILAAISRLHT
jgi:hypothetical protein